MVDGENHINYVHITGDTLDFFGVCAFYKTPTLLIIAYIDVV